MDYTTVNKTWASCNTHGTHSWRECGRVYLLQIHWFLEGSTGLWHGQLPMILWLWAHGMCKYYKNCPITIINIRNAKKTFGLNIGSLCRWTLQHRPDPVVLEYIAIPPEILDQNINLDITVDLMFVNKIPFLVTLVKWVKFATIENLLNILLLIRLKGMRLVIILYNKQKRCLYYVYGQLIWFPEIWS